jgi:hypothetical protein
MTKGIISRPLYIHDPSDASPIVVYLLINRINEMPRMSIQSCLDNSTSKIVIGCLNESDLIDIPIDPRVSILKLETLSDLSAEGIESNYKAFDSLDFFILVTYKWLLFKSLFNDGVQHLIYSDLDVLWFDDVSQVLVQTHREFTSSKLLIQSVTTTPSKPRLCMGLVSIINSPETQNLIDYCYKEHIREVQSGNKIGDDDVISAFYTSHGYPDWIRELPQVTFPVGMLLNTYVRNSLFPGLRSVKPYIFHANYVVGEKNKILLLKIVNKLITGISSRRSLGFYWIMYLGLKRLKFKVGTLKRKIKR